MVFKSKMNYYRKIKLNWKKFSTKGYVKKNKNI
jgi:hypothetical protein